MEAETETLKLVKRQGLDVKVRLVWIKADPDLQMKHELQDGEYVEIEGFLGRHKVYRPVDDDPASVPRVGHCLLQFTSRCRGELRQRRASFFSSRKPMLPAVASRPRTTCRPR